MDVKEGDILAGKYRVETILGQGGMGVVVAATHLQLEQRVALKFLLPEALQSPDTLARFSREARAAAKLKSEHVARVIDVGTLETGIPYIVMEYLEGSDLSAYLRGHGSLRIEHAAQLILEACEGLAEAHVMGIVHRDLKPANLFLARSPGRTDCIKILDFGISKVVSPEAAEFEMTRTGAVMGSPYYMSPEQMRSSRTVDARADIWSLGVILYELVSGRVPFDATTLPQLCGMILTDPPPALRQWRPDVPAGFLAMVMRCLEKEPQQRFQSVAALAVALAEFAPAGAARSVERILRLSGASATPSDRAPDGEGSERSIRTDWGRTSTRGRRSRGVWGVLVALVLVAGAGSWLFFRKHMATTDGSHAAVSAAATALPAPPMAPIAGSSQMPETVETLAPAVPASTSITPDVSPSPKRTKRAEGTPKPAAVASAPAPQAPAPAPKPSPNPLDGRL